MTARDLSAEAEEQHIQTSEECKPLQGINRGLDVPPKTLLEPS